MTDTLAAFAAYYRDRCVSPSERQVTCAHCGGDIHRVRGMLLLHDERFGDACAGPGRALRMDIPFCPQCEARPAEFGCIHLPEPDMQLPSVLEASRPYGTPHPLCAGVSQSAEA